MAEKSNEIIAIRKLRARAAPSVTRRVVNAIVVIPAAGQATLRDNVALTLRCRKALPQHGSMVTLN